MSLDLEVLVPDGVVVRARASAVRAADASGSFGLLPGHQAFLTVLVPGLLIYRHVDGREHYVAVDRGVLLLEGSRVSVATRDAVVAERLEEVADAAAAMLARRRAEERMAQTAFRELEAALRRQLAMAERRR